MAPRTDIKVIEGMDKTRRSDCPPRPLKLPQPAETRCHQVERRGVEVVAGNRQSRTQQLFVRGNLRNSAISLRILRSALPLTEDFTEVGELAAEVDVVGFAVILPPVAS